jgi:cytochrome c oxidase assembly factor CtaG
MTFSLGLVFVAYAIGLVRFRRHARGNSVPAIARALAVGGGLLIIELALASPLDELADQLLSAHMTQHLLLMLVAAPLIVWGRPTPYFVWFLPIPLRKGVAYLWNPLGASQLIRFLKKPAIGWGAFCGVALLWHVPAVYRWAVGGELRHALMHLSFLGSGLLFWSVVLQTRRQRSFDYASAGLFVFSAALLTGLPGALIAFARRPLYIDEQSGRMPFGLTALADQQLAGLIMWIPMDLILFSVALALFAAALGVRRIDFGTRTGRAVTLLNSVEEAKDARHA